MFHIRTNVRGRRGYARVGMDSRRQASLRRCAYVSCFVLALTIVFCYKLDASPTIDRINSAAILKSRALSVRESFEQLFWMLHSVDVGYKCAIWSDSDCDKCDEVGGKSGAAVVGHRVCADYLATECRVLSLGYSECCQMERVMTRQFGCTVQIFGETNRTHLKSSKMMLHDVKDMPAIRDVFQTFEDESHDTILDLVKLDVKSGEWYVLEQMLNDAVANVSRIRQLSLRLHLNAPRLDRIHSSQTSFQQSGIHGEEISPGDILLENSGFFSDILNQLKNVSFKLVYSVPDPVCVQLEIGCLSVAYQTLWINDEIYMLSHRPHSQS